MSSAEDNDAVIKDAGVWYTIVFRVKGNCTSLVVSFQFFFQLIDTTDQNTIEISTLDLCLEKRFFSIWKTLKKGVVESTNRTLQ